MSDVTVKIGVDLDGVLYDWGAAMRAYIHEEIGYPLEKMADPSQWNTWEAWGIDKPSFFRFFREGVERGRVWRHGDLEPDVLPTLYRLKNAGDTVHIVTYRNHMGATGMANTALWLEEQQVPFDTLTFGADKCCVPVDIFIEDNVENYWAIERSGAVPVLFTRPWNASVPYDFRRVSSFEGFGDIVEGYRAWREEYPFLKNHRAKDYL